MKPVWTLLATVATGFLVAVPRVATAADAPARVDADTTWTAAASPYRVAAETRVAEDATLTIEPGVVVELADGASLVVDGELVARGTEASPILFTGVEVGGPDDHWESVLFTDGSVDATFVDVDEYASGSILEWCVFEYAAHAVRTTGASPYVASSVFSNNVTEPTIAPPGGAAMLIEEGSAPRVRDCTFENNETRGFGYGGAIYASFSAPIIQNNTFTGSLSAYGGAVSTDTLWSPIVGNHFEGNETLTEGGAISLFASSPAFLNNTVVGNHAALDGGGVHVCVECFPHANPFVIDNTIADNTSANDDSRDGAAGLGAAYLRACFDNDLQGNLRADTPSDFGWFQEREWGYVDELANPSVAGNWWGTTDTQAVAERIFDGADDEALGTVTFEPVRQGPVEAPTPRVTITARKIAFADPGDPMDVFLTLYNPGAERDLLLQVMLQYEDAPPVPVEVVDLVPSATTELGTTRLTMPDDAVVFRTLAAPPYPGVGDVHHGYWHAAIFDAATGERIGAVSSTRFEMSTPDGHQGGPRGGR